MTIKLLRMRAQYFARERSGLRGLGIICWRLPLGTMQAPATVSSVLSSAKFISTHAQQVKISQSGVTKAARKVGIYGRTNKKDYVYLKEVVLYDLYSLLPPPSLPPSLPSSLPPFFPHPVLHFILTSLNTAVLCYGL